MSVQVDHRRQALQLLEQQDGYLRDRDLRRSGGDPHVLAELLADGTLERVARGLYRRVGAWSMYQSLLDATALAPGAVVCLLSALEFYELTTTVPPAIYLAIPRKARPPHLSYPPLQVVRYSERMFSYGVTEQLLPDTRRRLRVYSREKCIADALYFAERIGRDIAVEALRTYLRQPARNFDELLRAAEVCRVRQTMIDFLELTA